MSFTPMRDPYRNSRSPEWLAAIGDPDEMADAAAERIRAYGSESIAGKVYPTASRDVRTEG